MRTEGIKAEIWKGSQGRLWGLEEGELEHRCVPGTNANGCRSCTGGTGYVWSRSESTICPHPAGGNRLVKSQDLCPGHSDALY